MHLRLQSVTQSGRQQRRQQQQQQQQQSAARQEECCDDRASLTVSLHAHETFGARRVT